MIGLLRPPSHGERVPKAETDKEYRRLRLQVFMGVFVGYAGYYFVRKNFSLAMPYLIEEGYSRTELGFALSGIAIAYGLSKFLMGSVSDRSNARTFMALGLAVSSVIMIVLGTVPFATASVTMMFTLLLLNGWFQGMGWPPSGRTMVHWFSASERGTKMAFWNVAHNVGGGLVGPIAILGVAVFSDWHAILYTHGLLSLLVVVFILLTVRDTPQSQGLPPIEEHRNDYPKTFEYEATHEKEFSTKEIFFGHVFNNKLLWSIALANAFVYLVRYGVLDWAPTYLGEVKQFSFDDSSWAYALYEWAGIPGTLLCGWMSDKFFRGRRAPVSIVYMFLTGVCVVIYWLNPAGNPALDIAMLIAIGFLIYGPVMLIGVHALDLVPKKAAGTAAGFTGLFGYVGGAVSANVVIGALVDSYGWDAGFLLIAGSCLVAIILIAMTWKAEQRSLGHV
ncbi:MAG: glycerol-3-phosphate transporter [Bacteroidetes Order II. Incertae sedis bacterium]|jgi:MFS transporter, OPA family, glycerol-3-phosphate transporter|nr:glycerol-3-phosphate transporter [Bacteroidetes Order II. bacterium]MBT4053267.1 glycerol-3-phosphate transporter [Bacteroidetes Order II. bacterium]MBT5250492.1 glycerol-3-phosphate transporter [Bacteroidetes Order II. bacterium]MBT6199834.1 glycerol-3-phosphate transporter [Bacteroidetes Order II. bacterium]MBT6424688.1 glycerol-3-phosphate transporter [Bacteroidetes Order II. bacterium]